MIPNNHKKILTKHVFAIYGLGNVGGSIAAVWLRAGAKIIGVDISETLINKIKSGNSHKKEPLLSQTFTDALKNVDSLFHQMEYMHQKNHLLKLLQFL